MANAPAVPVRLLVQADPVPALRVPAQRPARVPQPAQADPVPAVPVRVPAAETGPRLA
jgi:hypothetical protein